MINPETLTDEFNAAGISTGGCNANGVVWDVDGKTEIQTRNDIKAVIVVHNPTKTKLSEIEKIIARIIALEEKVNKK